MDCKGRALHVNTFGVRRVQQARDTALAALLSASDESKDLWFQLSSFHFSLSLWDAHSLCQNWLSLVR